MVIRFASNTNSHFFTVELKVTKSNRVTFSPHQIAFHVRHPNNTFILTKHLASRDVKLYEGKDIMELVACGLKLDASFILRLDASGIEVSQPFFGYDWSSHLVFSV